MEGASWIRRREDNKLSIHPLIRQILKNELAPKAENCEEFLAALWKKFEFRYPQNAELFQQAAELYKNAAENLEDKFGKFNYRTGHCFLIIRRFADADIYSNRAMRIQEKVLSMWDISLAPTYNDVGVVSLKFYDESKAEKAFMCAYALCKKTAPDNPYFADAHLNLSEIFAKKEDYNNALFFARDAIKILKNQPPQLEFKLANAHNELGHILKCIGKYEDALKNIEIAAEIYKRISLFAGSPDLAVCYRNIADMHVIFGNTEKAVEYIERAIQMQEKILPPNHTDLFNSYYRATKIYQMSQNIDKFFLCSKKISAISNERQKRYAVHMLQFALHILEVDRNLTLEMRARRYCNVADAYQKLKDYENAEKYILLSIKQISLGVKDPFEILNIYCTASQIYREKKNFEVSFQYAKDSLAVAEKISPQNFGSLAMCYIQMGLLYGDMNLKSESQICFQKAREFDFMDKATGTQNLVQSTDWRHINEI